MAWEYLIYKLLHGACNIWEQVQEVKLGSSTFGDVHLFRFLHSDSKLLLTNTDIDKIEDFSRGVSQILSKPVIVIEDFIKRLESRDTNLQG